MSSRRSSSSAALTWAAENRGSLTLWTASCARARVRSPPPPDVQQALRDAILRIALPSPPAPITSAFMVKINSKRDSTRSLT